MSKHKHSEVIKAWADGATIEVMMNEGSWVLDGNPTWNKANAYRVRPAKIYPVTQMTDGELSSAYGVFYGCVRDVANSAIKHAIDAGQVVIAEDRVARDMAIAAAVLKHSTNHIAGGNFLHAESPGAKFAHECVNALERNIKLAALVAQVK